VDSESDRDYHYSAIDYRLTPVLGSKGESLARMNKKLYVGNLPLSAEVGQLQAIFGEEGRQVASVRILNDRETGRSRGFAFIEMATSADAQRAIDAINGRQFMGRALTVNEAREQAPRNSSDFGGGRGRD
jgi:cold-inducible RNA-binding protein